MLEITRSRSPSRAFLRSSLATHSPLIGRITTLAPRMPELRAYYWQTIDRCILPERVLQALYDAGFTQVSRRTCFGIFSEYPAAKPHP